MPDVTTGCHEGGRDDDDGMTSTVARHGDGGEGSRVGIVIALVAPPRPGAVLERPPNDECGRAGRAVDAAAAAVINNVDVDEDEDASK